MIVLLCSPINRRRDKEWGEVGWLWLHSWRWGAAEGVVPACPPLSPLVVLPMKSLAESHCPCMHTHVIEMLGGFYDIRRSFVFLYLHPALSEELPAGRKGKPEQMKLALPCPFNVGSLLYFSKWSFTGEQPSAEAQRGRNLELKPSSVLHAGSWMLYSSVKWECNSSTFLMGSSWDWKGMRYEMVEHCCEAGRHTRFCYGSCFYSLVTW